MISKRSQAVTAVAVAISALFVAASCGVQTGPDSFESIDVEDVPNRLAESTTTAASTTTSTTSVPTASESTDVPSSTGAPRTQPVQIYFLSLGRLRPVEYEVGVPAQPSDLVNELVSLLERGPTDGLLDSAVPRGLFNVGFGEESDGFRQERGTLTIDLDRETFEGIIELESQRTAFAQIVYTFLIGLDGVGTVLFTLDGEPLIVPTGNRLFTDEPVALDDYANMLVDVGPPESEPSTTPPPQSAPTSTDVVVTLEPGAVETSEPT